MRHVLVIIACLSFGFLTACQATGGGSTVSTSGAKEGGGGGGGC
jgi:hypothetical protein